MPSQLTWIDHDSKAREIALRTLSLFNEKESRDELGIGGIRDSFSDQLFPGTSTIQTRLRYMLFVPWIYQILEREKCPAKDFGKRSEELERYLIESLNSSSDNSGTIGRRSGRNIKTLPASIYWSGLGTWGIRLTPFSQEEYHRRIGEVYKGRNALKEFEKDAKLRDDDIDSEYKRATLTWHPGLPEPPDDFPEDAKFNLTKEESEFIRDRIKANCSDSLLSFLSLYCEPVSTDKPWKHPDYGLFSEDHQELLTHARLFSEIIYGAALIYNIQLAELYLQRHSNEKIDNKLKAHKDNFDHWIGKLPIEEIRSWPIDRLWNLVIGHGHKISSNTRTFVENWIDFICKSTKGLISNNSARNLIKNREMKLKKTYSRFINPRTLEQWGGSSGTGKLVYRWPNVKVLLNDLNMGLTRED